MRIVEICMNLERNTLQVKATSTRRLVEDAALAWSQGLKVEVDGAGALAAAGVVLPRLLADRLGLTAGATCLSDVEAMTAQEELFGPGGGVWDSTMLRALDELAERLGGDGLPRGAWPGSPRRRGSGLGGDRGPARAAAHRARCW